MESICSRAFTGTFSSPSTPVTNRLVDNTPPAVLIVDPGANLRGTVLLATNPAGTNDPGPNASGIVSTSYEVSSDAGATWQPVGASWNTTGGPDGLFAASPRLGR